MKKLIVIWTAILISTIGPQVHGNILVDFDHLPDGSWSIQQTPVGDSYAKWGLHFRSTGVSDMPIFADWGNPYHMYAGAFNCTYPPGHNIAVDFDIPVYGIAVDVSSAAGYTVMMIAKDMNGTIIDSVVSSPISAPYIFTGPLELNTVIPIATVEWWPSSQIGIVLIDNLNIIPEPASAAILLLGAAWMASKRK